MTTGTFAPVESLKRSLLEKDVRSSTRTTTATTTTVAPVSASRALSTTRLSTSSDGIQPQLHLQQQQQLQRATLQLLEQVVTDSCGKSVSASLRMITTTDTVAPNQLESSAAAVATVTAKRGNGNHENVAEAAYTCDVCLADSNVLETRSCCGVKICLPCFEEYLEERIMAGFTRIECVNCNRLIAAHNVLRALTRNGRLRIRDEFARLLRGDKKCPRCQLILVKFDGSSCPRCGLNWCFRCEATHEGVNCDQFSEVHRNQIKSWAQSVSEGQWNAQKCPRCKVYVQRASGCDHMHCAHCHTHFCYRCGKRLRHMKFFGDHHSKLSVFGCKYRYKPNQPIQRKLIRSAVFVARLVAIPLAGVGALCGLALVALLAVPMYAGYRVHRNVSARTNFNPKTSTTTATGRPSETKADSNEPSVSPPTYDSGSESSSRIVSPPQ
ncbi:probable E3 ubiquitin-protein ligase RNF217 [Varroa destructor]|uniref:RING-type domain-containing protein n=1 Tax=Varroa destructor TaxID=109461 RepID=A0A7M7M5G5_VARDE|nr:probable E3 ubiquitin-protein ligase RNF217 [Varroa destructor]